MFSINSKRNHFNLKKAKNTMFIIFLHVMSLNVGQCRIPYIKYLFREKMKKNVKTNSTYFIPNIEIKKPSLYPQCHQPAEHNPDKASNHITIQCYFTRKNIPFTDISVEPP